ncbi:MAG: hypothetical protein GXP55_02520, partial [Deltaproteobacteria bacterium]|nr:hypothetical protein [Deltaproteobacteria bacterium]
MHRLSAFRLRLEAAMAQRLFALPESVVRRLMGRPLVVQGQALEPHVELACRLARAIRRPPIQSLSPTEARADYHLSVSAVDLPGPTLPQ